MNTLVHDYENLYNLDVLGFKDKSIRDNETPYDEFKKQLGRNEEGCGKNISTLKRQQIREFG